MEWKPGRVLFEDHEIVAALRSTPPEKRIGNLWTFYGNLPRPEQDRLAALAGQSGASQPNDPAER